MTTPELVDLIVNRVQGYLLFLDVSNYPDTPELYRLSHPFGAVLVMYHSSAGSADHRDRAFDLVAAARTMADATRVIEAVRWIMTGWEPYPGGNRFYCAEDTFSQTDEGVWWYGSRFVLPGPAVRIRETDLQSRINLLFNI